MRHIRKNTKFKKGFTFVEVILYIAILTIVLGAIVPFAWNAIGLGVKSNTEQEVYTAARYLSERLKYEIRNADGIDASSDFDTNLVSDASKELSLSQVGSSSSTVFSVSDGRVFVSQGGGDPVVLQSNDTKVTDLTFTDYSSDDGKTKNIGFTLTVEANYPNAGMRQEYQESVTLESGAEIRNNIL